MKRTILWTDHAAGQLMRLSWEVRDRIEEKVSELAMNPGSLGKQVKRLKGSRLLRLRVGDYRVIFSDEGVILTIFRVGHRKDVYE
jgi:mRNA interferase RelE/StbE